MKTRYQLIKTYPGSGSEGTISNKDFCKNYPDNYKRIWEDEFTIDPSDVPKWVVNKYGTRINRGDTVKSFSFGSFKANFIEAIPGNPRHVVIYNNARNNDRSLPTICDYDSLENIVKINNEVEEINIEDINAKIDAISPIEYFWKLIEDNYISTEMHENTCRHLERLTAIFRGDA